MAADMMQETVVVYPITKYEYLQQFEKSKLKALEEKVTVSFSEDGLSLSGSRANVKECVGLVKELIDSVAFETQIIAKHGAKKVFEDPDEHFEERIAIKTSCLVKMVDDAQAKQDALLASPLTKSVYKTQTSEGAKIFVSNADICSYPVHAIVNTTEEDLQLNSQLAAAVLEAAGKQLQEECDKIHRSQGNLKPGNCVVTDAGGSLVCQKIIHAIGPQYDEQNALRVKAQLKRAVKVSLELAEQHQCESLAIPAISHNRNFPLKVCTQVIVYSVQDYFEDLIEEGFLKSVHFVSNDDAVVAAMEEAVKKEFGDRGVRLKMASASSPATEPATESKQDAGDESRKEFPKAGGSSTAESAASSGASFVPPSPQKMEESDDFELETLKPAPLCFHICGASAEEINATKNKIDSILAKRLQKIPIQDETILSLSADNRKQLMDIQRSKGVGISMERLDDEGILSIEGLAADVLAVSLQIHEMLRTVQHEEDLNEKAQMLSEIVEWRFAFPGQDQQSFDPKTAYLLEEAFDYKLKEVKVKLNFEEFTVKMPNGPATNRDGVTLTIQRVDKSDFDLPDTWEPMDTCATKVFQVTTGSAEYLTVEQLFKASCNRTITKIERIQNPVLWQSLQIKRTAMDQKNGHSNNVRQLFHGTSEETVSFINHSGFNRSYAGKNATAYGRGTYFAVNAHYSSHNTYSKPNRNGDKMMYLCSVLTGDFTAGSSWMIEPPVKKAGSLEKYDSVVDSTSNPNMFIIFHDSSAYPAYLITFK